MEGVDKKTRHTPSLPREILDIIIRDIDRKLHLRLVWSEWGKQIIKLFLD